MPAVLGFIDHGDGANLRNIPAELPGSRPLTVPPLPPGTAVTVLRSHPTRREWSYVVAAAGNYVLRGYVQAMRINTALPETAATLHHVQPGERLEPLAARYYHQGIQPGRDLRFYENVILYVNQRAGRAGVRVVEDDVQLVAGHRIWLVSVAFANTLQSIVPSGSITGGLIASAKTATRHLDDILASVNESPNYLGTVAGEYAAAISEHKWEIIGIVVAFITLEGLSVFLAATPTGVGQLAAAFIQLVLAAFGAQGVVDAGVEAVKHAQQWLTLAWKANGSAAQIAEASKSFIRMVVSIAMAVMAWMGMKSNLNRGLKLADGVKITPPTVMMMQTAGGHGGSVAIPVFRPGSITATSAVAVAVNPLTGPAAAAAKTKVSPAKEKPTERVLDDAEVERLLEQLPNWDKIKDLVGKRIPRPGTPEFNAIKRELEAAGYKLDVLKEGPQPYRLRRPSGKATGDELAALTVTEDAMIALRSKGTNRISVYSRYRKNYLERVKELHGQQAADAAAARISAGNQLHHVIPDAVAQRHPLLLEALKRLEGDTIDRGTNMLEMPSVKNPEGKILHLGSHPEYNKFVTLELDNALKRLAPPAKLSTQVIKDVLGKVEDKLRKAIESGDLNPKVLKELIEDGIVVGRKLAMRELPHHSETLTA